MSDRDKLRASILYAKATYLVLANYLPQKSNSTYTDLNNLANLFSIATSPDTDQLRRYINMFIDKKIFKGAEILNNLLQHTTLYNRYALSNSISIMLALINGLTAAYCATHGIRPPVLRRSMIDLEPPTREFPENLTCRFCNHPLRQHYSVCPGCRAASTNDTATPVGIPFPRIDAETEYDFPQYPLDPESGIYYAVLRAIYIITKGQSHNPISDLAKQALQRIASVTYANPSTFTPFINNLVSQLIDHLHVQPSAIVAMINEMAMTLDSFCVKKPPLNADELLTIQPTPNITLPRITGERCAICGATITHEEQLLPYYNGCSECTSTRTCASCKKPLPLYNHPNTQYLATTGWSLTVTSQILTCGHCGHRPRPHGRSSKTNNISHKPVLSPIISKQDYTVGIEVEGSAYFRRMKIPGWKTGTDGSIRGLQFPIELRSRVIKSTELHKFLQRSHAFLSQMEVNATCGLHVHIGTKGLSWFDIYRIMVYCAVYEPVFTSTQPLSRRNAEYCGYLTVPSGVKTKKEFYETMYRKGNVIRNRGLKYPLDSNIKRNTWLNVHSRLYHGTLEFRLHAGTSDILKIYHWIQFLISSIDHAIYVHPSKWDTPLNVCPEQTRTYMVERIKRFGGQATFNRVDPSYTYSILEGTKKGSDVINIFGTVKLVRPAELS